MKHIVETQLAYQKALGYGPESFDTDEAWMQYLRDLCLALNVEVTEFLQELPWKPWRPIQVQPLDIEAAEDEAVDIIIFALNLWINLKKRHPGQCGQELEERIIAKQMIIDERLTSGYNKTKQGETK